MSTTTTTTKLSLPGEALRIAHRFASSDEGRPSLLGVCLDRGYLVATDGRVLVAFRLSDSHYIEGQLRFRILKAIPKSVSWVEIDLGAGVDSRSPIGYLWTPKAKHTPAAIEWPAEGFPNWRQVVRSACHGFRSDNPFQNAGGIVGLDGDLLRRLEGLSLSLLCPDVHSTTKALIFSVACEDISGVEDGLVLVIPRRIESDQAVETFSHFANLEESV